MKKSYIFLTVFMSLLCLSNLKGQTITPYILNSAGGTGAVGSTTIDWSIGEMILVSTFTASTVTVTQGVLQPVTGPWVGITNVNLVNNLMVFPNPANSIINIQYTSTTQGLLKYKLMNMTGRTIMSKDAQVTQNVTLEQLNISDLAAATYLLEVAFEANGSAKEMTSYKIDKLK